MVRLLCTQAKTSPVGDYCTNMQKENVHLLCGMAQCYYFILRIDFFFIHFLSHFKILVPVSDTICHCSGWSYFTGLIIIHDFTWPVPRSQHKEFEFQTLFLRYRLNLQRKLPDAVLAFCSEQLAKPPSLPKLLP